MWAARGLGFIWLRVPVSEMISNVLSMKPRKGRWVRSMAGALRGEGEASGKGELGGRSWRPNR